METKKYEHRRMERKIPLFYMIGLNVALLLTILAFEVKTDPLEPKIPDSNGGSIFDSLIYIPATKFEPPKPKPTSYDINEVKEEIAKTDVKIDEPVIETDPINEGDIGDVFEGLPEIIDNPADEPFIFVEEMPSYPGGWSKFYEFLSDNIKYPKQAQRIGIEGRVHLQFTIERDGSISDLIVVKGMEGGLNEEALRVMKLIPKFNPGKQRGKPVRVKQAISINFTLRK